MSVPGPNARQFWELPPHVEFEKSQSIPVSLHLGPLIFGDTSPEFDEANAATNRPCGDILFLGGFHLVDLIIKELKDHMTCYKFECSHWWKICL